MILFMPAVLYTKSSFTSRLSPSLSQQHSSTKELLSVITFLSLNFLIGRPSCSIWFSDVLNRLFSVSIWIVSCIALCFLFLFFSFLFCKDLSLIVVTILSAKALKLKWLGNLEIVIKWWTALTENMKKHESAKLWLNWDLGE